MIDLDIFGRGRIRELEFDNRELRERIEELERTVRAQQDALNRRRDELDETTCKLRACRDVAEHEREKVQVLERMVLSGEKARKGLGDKLKKAQAECSRLREAQHEPERDSVIQEHQTATDEDGRVTSSYIRCTLKERPRVRGGKIVLPDKRRRKRKE